MKKALAFKLENFIFSLGTAMFLASKAKQDKHFIELVCLYASIIDGVLRLTLLMKKDLESKAGAIEERLIFQGLKDKKITERFIYKEAMDNKIIPKSHHRKLNILYEKRNRVIHRYIISDIKHSDVDKLAKDYSILLNDIMKRHRIYRAKLIKSNSEFAKYFLGSISFEHIESQTKKKMR